MTIKTYQGTGLVYDPANAPVGTIVTGEDAGIPGTSTAAFTGATATFCSITVAQFANAGAAAQYGAVYVVFNSSDPATDLANVAVRTALYIENGRGQTKRKVFQPRNLTSMHYLSTNTSADLVIKWEYK